MAAERAVEIAGAQSQPGAGGLAYRSVENGADAVEVEGDADFVVQSTPSLYIVGEDRLFDAFDDGNFFQFAQNRQCRLDIDQRAVEVEFDAEVRGGGFLHRLGLFDHVVEGPGFALESAIAARGGFCHFGCRVLGRHRGHPPAHAYPFSDLLAHEFRGRDSKVLAH